jgi:hypothetical protein
MLYIQYIYTLQVHMSTDGIVILCIELCPRKYIVLNGNFVFDLCDLNLLSILSGT